MGCDLLPSDRSIHSSLLDRLHRALLNPAQPIRSPSIILSPPFSMAAVRAQAGDSSWPRSCNSRPISWNLPVPGYYGETPIWDHEDCVETPVWDLDDYEVTAELGSGNFGTVTKAWSYNTGESVAIKTLSLSSHDAVRREAGLLRACRGHRSIVQLRAMSSDPGADRLSLVMEYVGPSLHDVLHGARRGCPFQEEVVRYLMRQLLSGADHMHRRCGVVHLDIKPENVLIGDGVKICDFGLAMRMSQSPPYGQRGTRSYMAPEILLGKPNYDAKVDAWSLGCVMAELLLGERLFGRAADDADQLLRIFYILGVPDRISWPSYSSMPLAGELVTPPSIPHRDRLREMIPEDCLSRQGFQVLSGLLSCDAHKRLSAADALELPWLAIN